MTPSPSSREEARELKDDPRLCPACGTALWVRQSRAPDDLVSCQCTAASVEWIDRAARFTRPTPELGDVDELATEIAPVVARALAKRHGLGDHMPVDAWMKEAVVATRTTITALSTRTPAVSADIVERLKGALEQAADQLHACGDMLESRHVEPLATRAVERNCRAALAAIDVPE